MVQAGQSDTTNSVITVADLTLREGEARVRDLELAKALYMADPHAIRRTIRKYRNTLATFGLLVSDIDRKPGKRGGRPGITYLLNRKQALYITAKSETERAAEVTIQMVEVFDAHLAGQSTKPVTVEAHTRSLPRRPRAQRPVSVVATPTIEREGFAAMRLGGETVLVDLLHLDVAPGHRAVVIGWDAAITIQDMTEARSNAKFLGDRSFLIPDPTNAKTGRRSVFAVGTVVATQPAAAPTKGEPAGPRPAKRAKPPRAMPAMPRRPDLAAVAVCGTA